MLAKRGPCDPLAGTFRAADDDSVAFPMLLEPDTRLHVRAPIVAIITLLGLVATTSADDKEAPPLKKGERIVFLGDSITAGGVAAKGYVTLIKNTIAEKH